MIIVLYSSNRINLPSFISNHRVICEFVPHKLVSVDDGWNTLKEAGYLKIVVGESHVKDYFGRPFVGIFGDI